MGRLTMTFVVGFIYTTLVSSMAGRSNLGHRYTISDLLGSNLFPIPNLRQKLAY